MYKRFQALDLSRAEIGNLHEGYIYVYLSVTFESY